MRSIEPLTGTISGQQNLYILELYVKHKINKCLNKRESEVWVKSKTSQLSRQFLKDHRNKNIKTEIRNQLGQLNSRLITSEERMNKLEDGTGEIVQKSIQWNKEMGNIKDILKDMKNRVRIVLEVIRYT